MSETKYEGVGPDFLPIQPDTQPEPEFVVEDVRGKYITQVGKHDLYFIKQSGAVPIAEKSARALNPTDGKFILYRDKTDKKLVLTIDADNTSVRVGKKPHGRQVLVVVYVGRFGAKVEYGKETAWLDEGEYYVTHAGGVPVAEP